MTEDFGRLALVAQEGAGHYFGVDIQAKLEEWWNGDLLELMRGSLDGEPFDAAAVVLWASDGNWREPLQNCLHYVGDLDRDHHVGPEGLFRNIAGMLRFAMRTGCDSYVSEGSVHLVEPGDYPQAGAVRYQSFWIATSGMMPDENVMLSKKLGAKLVDLRSEVAFAVRHQNVLHGTTPADKYFGADPVTAASSATFSFR